MAESTTDQPGPDSVQEVSGGCKGVICSSDVGITG